MAEGRYVPGPLLPYYQSGGQGWGKAYDSGIVFATLPTSPRYKEIRRNVSLALAGFLIVILLATWGR